MIRFLRRLGLALAVLMLFLGGVVLLVGPRHFPRLMALTGAGNASYALGGSFALTEAASGRPFTAEDLRGRWSLVYFGYTFCPDVCPTDLAKAVQALAQLGARQAEITPIFVTVDPARDSGPVLTRYLALFSPRLIGLTGSAGAIAAAEQAFHVYAEKQPVPNGGGAYLMNHSAFFYLVNPQGRLAAVLPPDLDAAQMARAIGRALAAAPLS